MANEFWKVPKDSPKFTAEMLCRAYDRWLAYDDYPEYFIQPGRSEHVHVTWQWRPLHRYEKWQGRCHDCGKDL